VCSAPAVQLSAHSNLACRCMKSLGVAQGAAQRGRDRVGDRTARQTVRAVHAGKSLDCRRRPMCTRTCVWPTVPFPSLLGRKANAVTRRRFWPYSSAGKSWTSVTRTRLSPGICALKSACDGDVYAVHRHASMRTFAHACAQARTQTHTGHPLFLLNQVRAATGAQGCVGRHGHLFRGTPHPQPVCLCPGLPPAPTQRMEEGWPQATMRAFYFYFFHYDLCLGIGSSSAWRRGGLRQLRELF